VSKTYDLFTLNEKGAPISQEKDPADILIISIEINPDKIFINRDIYTILDVISDIGGL